jgi:SAM-dependent methyltransferase
MKNVFEDIIKHRRWSEVTCGSGSTLKNTESLREQLVPFLQKHNITSMADIPCGDFSWMSLVEFPEGFRYVGGDIVGFMVEENRQKWPDVEFLEFDISQDPIPDVDLLFCRDCLFHFSLNDIEKTLANICKSNIKYVMFTSYYDGENHDIATGSFRPLSFTATPFNFSEPIDFIREDMPKEKSRRICLWSIETIKGYLNQ